MKTITVFLFVWALVLPAMGTDSGEQGGKAKRTEVSKRNLSQFGTIIACLQEHEYSYESALKYNDYGCYCGIGGQGTPVDETDKCCKAHDECYGNAEYACSGAPGLFYSVLYNYEVENCGADTAAVTCGGTDSYYWFEQWYSDCGVAICECDKLASACFKQNLNTYSENHFSLTDDKCQA